jgi:hypothetical protein
MRAPPSSAMVVPHRLEVDPRHASDPVLVIAQVRLICHERFGALAVRFPLFAREKVLLAKSVPEAPSGGRGRVSCGSVRQMRSRADSGAVTGSLGLRLSCGQPLMSTTYMDSAKNSQARTATARYCCTAAPATLGLPSAWSVRGCYRTHRHRRKRASRVPATAPGTAPRTRPSYRAWRRPNGRIR